MSHPSFFNAMERIILFVWFECSRLGVPQNQSAGKNGRTVWLQLKRTPLLPLKQQWLKQRRRNYFMIPHDSDAVSDSIRIIMTGEQSGDPDNDTLDSNGAGKRRLFDVDSDTNAAASFSAVNGEYASG